MHLCKNKIYDKLWVEKKTKWFHLFSLQIGGCIMKKWIAVVLIISILIPVHVHDDECGYDPETGDGCKYAEIVYQPNLKWPPEG